MVYRISTYNLYNTTTNNMNKVRNELSNITVKTGSRNLYRTFEELGLGSNIRSAINISTENQYYNTYAKNASYAKLKLDKMLNSLEQLYDIALDLDKSIIAFSGSIFYELDQLHDLGNTSLDVITRLINSDVNGSFIYAGSHSFTPPVIDLKVPNFTNDKDGNIDYLHGDVTTDYFQGDNIINKVILDDNFFLSYGLTADNPAFSKLIASVHLVLKAEGRDNNFINRARDLLRESINDIEILQQKVRYNYSIANKYENFYNDLKLEIIEIQEKIDEDNNVDFFHLMTDYSNNESILSASQYMFSHINKMSILEYL